MILRNRHLERKKGTNPKLKSRRGVRGAGSVCYRENMRLVVDFSRPPPVNEPRHLVERQRRRAAEMADYSSVAPPSSNSGGGMNDAFKDALQRARQVITVCKRLQPQTGRNIKADVDFVRFCCLEMKARVAKLVFHDITAAPHRRV